MERLENILLDEKAMCRGRDSVPLFVSMLLYMRNLLEGHTETKEMVWGGEEGTWEFEGER